ncbi:MAG: adenylyltransferase/cytidyltransferase family protein [Candidatus Aenigmatarchaeota archaeon]
MKIVLTGGTFNRLHPGHTYLLKKAKALGYLVVVLAHDRHNKKSNAIPAIQRKKNLEKLGIADKIVIGNNEDYSKVVKRFKPDIIILGYDQSLPSIKTTAKIIRMKRFGRY